MKSLKKSKSVKRMQTNEDKERVKSAEENIENVEEVLAVEEKKEEG